MTCGSLAGPVFIGVAAGVGRLPRLCMARLRLLIPCVGVWGGRVYSVVVEGLCKAYRLREVSVPIYDNVNQPLVLLYLKLAERLRGGVRTVYALRDVSFSVGRGSIMAVLGPNGSGKTTLLRILAGLAYPSSGRAVVEGLDVVEDNGELGDVVMYMPGLVTVDLFTESNLTVRDNLRKYAELIGVGTERVDEVLALAGLEEYRDRLLYELSTGIISRLAFAFGILKEARVYLMDEPFTGISYETRRRLMGLIRETLVGRLGATVLLATHVLGDAEELCSSYVFLRRGEVVAEGTLGELRRRLRLRDKVVLEAVISRDVLEGVARGLGLEGYGIGEGEHGLRLEFMVEDASAVVPGLIEGVYRGGGRVVSVNVGEPSLEEVYMELFGGEWEEPVAVGGDVCSLVVG